jgi:hypothetical protein
MLSYLLYASSDSCGEIGQYGNCELYSMMGILECHLSKN